MAAPGQLDLGTQMTLEAILYSYGTVTPEKSSSLGLWPLGKQLSPKHSCGALPLPSMTHGPWLLLLLDEHPRR